MAEDPIYVERTVVTDTDPVRTANSNAAGWWIAALVAVIAVAGLIFMYVNQNNQTDLQAARDQGAAEATLDSATANAQMAAAQATQAAQAATAGASRATENAAASAQAAASQAAQSAQNAADTARDAAGTEPAPVQ